MKNKYFFSFILFICYMSYSMEQSNQLVIPDWKSMHTQLVDTDYYIYLRHRAEEYRKVDITTASWDMDNLITVGTMITKKSENELKSQIYRTETFDGNTFLHVAVKKNDTRAVEWLSSSSLLEKNHCYISHGAGGMSAFELCLEKLSPEISADERVISREIFDKMLSYIKKNRASMAGKTERYLEKIIALQLQHVRNNSEFIVDQNVLQKLIPNSSNLSLAHYYRQANNEADGCTFTHALCHDPDRLFELVKQDRISFEKNYKGKSALDCTLERLQVYAQNTTQIIEKSEDFQKASCCVYILLNYAKKLAQGVSDTADVSEFGSCCDKHTLLKVV